MDAFDLIGIMSNALVYERVLYQDFWYSLLNTTFIALLVVVGYLSCFALLDYELQPVTLPVLTILSIFAQMSLRWVERFADLLLLPHWKQGAREQLIDMHQEIIISTIPTSAMMNAEAKFQRLVEKSSRDSLEELILVELEKIFQYNRFQDDSFLVTCQLSRLRSVECIVRQIAHQQQLAEDDLSLVQRGMAVRRWLTETITRRLAELKQASVSETTQAQQLAYFLLYKKYIESLSRNEVEQAIEANYHILVSGGAYSRLLRTARSYVASDLCDHEMALRTSDYIENS